MGELIYTVGGDSNLVSCKSAAKVPFNSLKVEFAPIQSGSGDPSPSNIRLINGWTGVNVSHTGKDLFDYSAATTYSLSWQSEAGTVYGGYVDLVSGILTVTKFELVFDGTEKWTLNNSSGNYTPYYYLNISQNAASADVLCSHSSQTALSISNSYIGCNITTVRGVLSFLIRLDSSVVSKTNVSAFKTWLAEQYTNGTPLTAIGTYVIPVTYQLTPQQLTTLLGHNNIWSDTNGNTTVSYPLVETGAIREAKRRFAYDNQEYVRNGLVLWLDGIDKGGTSGAWTDKAASHVFTNVNGMESGRNYVELSAAQSQYFQNTTFQAPSDIKNTTIEVVIADYAPAMMVFMPPSDGICFGVRSTGNQIITGAGSPHGSIIAYSNGSKLFSINYDMAFVDGNPVTASEHGHFSGTDGNAYIGRRSTGYYFSGKIYAIRIYNRKLSSAEMLHNQRIDNKRFGFGLSI